MRDKIAEANSRIKDAVQYAEAGDRVNTHASILAAIDVYYAIYEVYQGRASHRLAELAEKKVRRLLELATCVRVAKPTEIFIQNLKKEIDVAVEKKEESLSVVSDQEAPPADPPVVPTKIDAEDAAWKRAQEEFERRKQRAGDVPSQTNADGATGENAGEAAEKERNDGETPAEEHETKRMTKDDPFCFNHVDYAFPPIELLDDYLPDVCKQKKNEEAIEATIAALEKKLRELGVEATHVGYSVGATYTRVKMQMPRGMSVARIAGLEDDIAMAVRKKIRLEVPVIGEDTFGIELANQERETIGLKSIVGDKAFRDASGKVNFALGVNIEREAFFGDLTRAPHLLVAGTTGSGKTNFLHSLICSLFYRHTPDEVRLLLIDFKRVELNRYNGLPFLVGGKIVDNDDDALAMFDKLTAEMERRYELMERAHANAITEYNRNAKQKLPYIVTVIDEYADMKSSPYVKQFEMQMQRLIQKARASGIHIIISTQRPSVNVINGTIKANVPTKAAFTVQSKTDSRVILDECGAECLSGNGDMLFSQPGTQGTVRLQAAFLSAEEIGRVVDFILKAKDFTVSDKQEKETDEAMPVNDVLSESEMAEPVINADDETRVLDLLTDKYARQVVSQETISAELEIPIKTVVLLLKKCKDERLINVKVDGVLATLQAYDKLGKEFKPF